VKAGRDSDWIVTEQRQPAAHDYRDLIAWQKAMFLVRDTYTLTSSWPADERFGLTLQARRAAVSLPANVAEGSGRTGARHLRNHLSIAHDSLCELETHVLVAHDLGFMETPETDALLECSEEVGRIIRGSLRSLPSD
jgi:four helix bundle protein